MHLMMNVPRRLVIIVDGWEFRWRVRADVHAMGLKVICQKIGDNHLVRARLYMARVSKRKTGKA